MDLPKISLITPSYNQAAYLEQALKSVLRQNYPNLEYIVVDGGSTDGSVEILQRYGDRLSYWVSEPDGGQTRALNKGLALATGDILGWLCSDDLLEPWTLREVADFFRERPQAQVVYGDTSWIDPAGELIKNRRELPFNPFIFLYDHNFIPQPSTFWRRQLQTQVGELDPQFEVAMDADLWLRFATVTELHHVRRPWSSMRLYAEQKTQRLRGRAIEERRILIRRHYGPEADWSMDMKRLVAKGVRVGWKLAAGCYW
jgi:glycosyltransferase involved in cell wall biosynthesis